MTRLSLTETCLLDVSGELGKKAKAQLHEHMERIPKAYLEHELIRGQLDLLRSIPKPQMTDEQRRRMASTIKQGVHRKLRQIERTQIAAKRWRIVYHAMAGVSALAACLVITTGIFLVQNHVVQERRVAVARAEQNVREYLQSGPGNMTDYAYNNLNHEIQLAADNQSTHREDPATAELKLLEALDSISAHAPNSAEPGSL